MQNPTLEHLTVDQREGLLVAYAIDLASGINIKSMPFLKPKTIKHYLNAAASFALDALQPDPRYRTNKFGVRLSKCMFPDLHNWMQFLTKWDGPTNKAWSLDLKILLAMKSISATVPFVSMTSCAIDSIILGAYTGSRCSEYCKRTTKKNEPFAKVPANHFTREWGDYPIALISKDISFLTNERCVIPINASISKAQYVSVRFRFDKGGGQNFSVRTFKRLDTHPFLCPVRTAARLIHRWKHVSNDDMFPLCSYSSTHPTQPIVLADHQVTKLIRQAVILAYPNPQHLYRAHLDLFRTHSVRVFACCSLIAAGLTDEQIEYKLRWCSSAWKGYIRESFDEVDLTSLKLFHSAHLPPSNLTN